MGWPRKNDVMRLYRERDGSYCLVFVDDQNREAFEIVGNVHEGPRPSLCGTSMSRSYMAATRPKRVQWDELPTEWQAAFRVYLDTHEEPFKPEYIRGFWRISTKAQSH